ISAANASSEGSEEVATTTVRPVLAARFAASTAIGIPAMGSKAFAGNRVDVVRACRTATLATSQRSDRSFVGDQPGAEVSRTHPIRIVVTRVDEVFSNPLTILDPQRVLAPVVDRRQDLEIVRILVRVVRVLRPDHLLVQLLAGADANDLQLRLGRNHVG